jgi:hypothetical protein
MTRLVNIFIFFILTISNFGQINSSLSIIEGKVEHISSQYIYVRFENTEGLKVADTLFTIEKGKYSPKLKVEILSSRSCAATSINGHFNVGDIVYRILKPEQKIAEPVKKEKELQEPYTEIIKLDTAEFVGFRKRDEAIKGKISISGYSNLSNSVDEINYQNWRYSFSLNAENISDTRLSFSNYITFRYRADEWNYIRSNLNEALRIYDLSIRYDFNDNSNFHLGRKINRKTANIGAIDGIQFETGLNKFSFGGVFGSRPDYTDYGFNLDLLQFGGYISRSDSFNIGYMENTISIFQQMNGNTTDRRFFYFQHSNNLISNTNIFVSSEIDLYEKKAAETNNKPRFTSLYASIRYSPLFWISTSISYDARKNVIYYETFKDYASKLAEEALRQGFKLRVNLRPMKYIFASFYSGYRFRESDLKPSRNFGGSITHSRIPYIDMTANFSYIQLMTSYLDGNILGARMSKDLFNGTVNLSLGYKRINYQFTSADMELVQDVLLLDLSFRASRDIFISAYFEGTYQRAQSYANIFTNLTYRF